MNRALLAGIIGDDFNVVEAENGFQAVAQMRALGSAISLVLLDIVMPGMDGFDVLAVMNRYDWIRDIPVIMVSSETASSCVERAYELGVTDFISRPFDAHIIKRRVTNTLMLYAKQRALVGMVADQIYEREKATNLMVSILSHVVEFRNGESGLHVLHVSSMTDLLLNQVMRKTDRYGSDAGRRVAYRHRVEPARHRQDLHPRRGAQQARAVDGRRVRPDETAHGYRRADARRPSPVPQRAAGQDRA